MNTTIEEMPRCACGNPVDRDSWELAKRFPKIVTTASCAACAEAEDREESRRKRVLEQQMEQSRREARLEIIPPEMARTRINHPGFNAGLWVRVEGWQPSDVKWLGLVGGAGESKTRCLALLAKRLILSGIHLHWTTAVDFQEHAEATNRGDKDDAKEANRYLARCKHCGILVLDDLGKNTWNPTVERHLFSVLDHRKTHDLPVLWSANTSPLEILATGNLSRDRGAPLIGRLLEASRLEKA
jgi:hypothetical protein